MKSPAELDKSAIVKPSYSTISLETCFQTEFNLECSYDDYNC